jgi:protein-tyrosine phosphatase
MVEPASTGQVWRYSPRVPGAARVLRYLPAVRGFIDLHSHWVAGIDDGARDVEGSLALIRGLRSVGFDRVVATPHMRPGMFDNTAAALRRAYDATRAAIATAPDLPALDLSSEHFFDDIVFQRFMDGDVLLYPGGHAALVEFPTRGFPTHIAHRFFDLMRRRVRPVIAHPERYEPVWKDAAILDPLMDGGAVLLLDVAALAGKYGRAPRKAAEQLLEAGYYQAACSDAHGVKDVKDVADGIKKLFDQAGKEEATFLLSEGPREILEDRIAS